MRRSNQSRLAVPTIVTLLLTTTIVLSSGVAAHPSALYKWNQMESGTNADIRDVVAIDAAHVWAVTDKSEILFFNGSSWSIRASGGGEPLYGIDAVDNNNIWAVGDKGVMLHYDGLSWKSQNSGTDVPLTCVSALDSSHVWAAGDGGKILFYNGSYWSRRTIDSSAGFYGISALDSSHVWAVGAGVGTRDGQGAAFFFDGRGWSEVNTGADSPLHDVFAMDAQHVWAVGYGIRFFDGSSWSGQESETGDLFSGVTVVDGQAWAVGLPLAGIGAPWIILHSEDLRTWTEVGRAPSYTALRSISGFNSQHLWAVGSDGLIMSGELVPPPYWGTDSIGVTAPATTWYLTEGSTGEGFETWVLLANPGGEKATAHVSYMTPNGETAGPTVDLAAGTRKTINVADTVEGEYSVSTRVSSDKPILAERSMYGNDRIWGHNSIGVTAPAKTWYLAEGSTNDGNETWVLVMNPGDVQAHAQVTYMTPGGERLGPTLTLAPRTRQSINVADTVPNEWSVSTAVTSDELIVVERAMYGHHMIWVWGRTWGTDSIGVTAPATTWQLAEGSTGPGFETWVLLMNPGDAQALAQLTFTTPAGEIRGPALTLEPGTRQSINVADTVPNEWSVSTSVTSDEPVVAERAMYGNNRIWGHDSIGATAPAENWYLTEGSTGPGFETWVLLQNPNPNGVSVHLTFMTPGGEANGPTANILANSRTTFKLNDYIPDTWDVSTRVVSSGPEGANGVIVERAMYGGEQ